MASETSRTCYICGHANSEVIQSHHIVPRRYGGSDAGENLVDLCPNCHDSVERIYDDSFFDELGVEKETTDDDDQDTTLCAWDNCYNSDTRWLENTDRNYELCICDEHRVCGWFQPIIRSFPQDSTTKRCDRVQVTPFPVENRDRVMLLCEEHRVCDADGCSSENTHLFYEERPIGPEVPRTYCGPHATEQGFYE